ncbi:helix-turn-helix domain-containing protein [Ruegeria litorea]|nr:helix-turn-helix domain-containing protein [Falsiruegeria litorea]
MKHETGESDGGGQNSAKTEELECPSIQAPMMTVEAVAEHMNVSDRTAFRWIASGHLKAFRTGHVLRISGADLDVFIDNKSATWVTAHRQSRRFISCKINAKTAVVHTTPSWFSV